MRHLYLRPERLFRVFLLVTMTIIVLPQTARAQTITGLESLYRELYVEVSDYLSLLKKNERELTRFVSGTRIQVSEQRIQTVESVLRDASLSDSERRVLEEKLLAEQTVLRRQKLGKEFSREEIESRLDEAMAALKEVAGELGLPLPYCQLALSGSSNSI